MTNQARTVLNHLRTKGTLTRLEAYHMYGIAQLPTPVFALRKAGINVKATMKKDATGHRYARYALA